MSYKLDDEEASVPVPAEVLDVEVSGTEVDATLDGVEDETSVVVALGMVDNIVVPDGVVVSVDVEMSGITGTVDVEASGTAGGMLETVVVLASELFNVGAVDVELTKGGAFSIYKPLG